MSTLLGFPWFTRPRPQRALGAADLEHLASASPEVVAFHHPAYRGVSQSTRTLVGVHDHASCMALAEGDVATPGRRAALVAALAASGARCVVFSGFADGYASTIREIASALPGVTVRVMWHGSPLQNVEDCNWTPLREIIELAQEGAVDRVAFLKRGMAEVVARAGIETRWLRNFVQTLPNGASRTPTDGRVHIGVWDAGDSWRKNPHAVLSAAALVDESVVSGILDARSREWCQTIGVSLGRVQRTPLEHGALLQRLGGVHCNAYITLSECSPLLPLESLSLGAPCLVSATSHLFEDSEVLSKALVVDRFDDPPAIAVAVRAACEQREEIISAYRGYAPAYNEQAQEAVLGFLSD